MTGSKLEVIGMVLSAAITGSVLTGKNHGMTTEAFAAACLAVATLESGLNPRAQNPNTSARGVYQFLKSWEGTKIGKGEESLVFTDRYDVTESALVFGYYQTLRMVKYKKEGVVAQLAACALTHHFGGGGGATAMAGKRWKTGPRDARRPVTDEEVDKYIAHYRKLSRKFAKDTLPEMGAGPEINSILMTYVNAMQQEIIDRLERVKQDK